MSKITCFWSSIPRLLRTIHSHYWVWCWIGRGVVTGIYSAIVLQLFHVSSYFFLGNKMVWNEMCCAAAAVAAADCVAVYGMSRENVRVRVLSRKTHQQHKIKTQNLLVVVCVWMCSVSPDGSHIFALSCAPMGYSGAKCTECITHTHTHFEIVTREDERSKIHKCKNILEATFPFEYSVLGEKKNPFGERY